MTKLNKLRAIAALVLVTFSGVAAAALIATVNVIEVEGSEFKAPAHEADVLELQACNTCPVEAVQVSGATIYRLNGFNSRPVKLTELQRALRQGTTDTDMLIYISYEVSTLQVNEIVIEGSE